MLLKKLKFTDAFEVELQMRRNFDDIILQLGAFRVQLGVCVEIYLKKLRFLSSNTRIRQ
jgi:hypothetical protein